MPYPVMAVANEFIKRKIYDLTPLKLQKLIYFSNFWHFRITDPGEGDKKGEELVEEPFCRWEFGPVLPSLYHQLKKYESSRVTDPQGWLYLNSRKDDISYNVPYLPDDAYFAQNIIDQVIAKYGNYTGEQLSNLTHIENGSWMNNKHEKSKRGKADGSVITKEDMRDAYYP